MNKLWFTNFGLRHPVWVWGIVAVLAVLFGAQFPKVTFDNDPENMLAADEYIRVFHNQVKQQYQLYDFVIVGIVNRTHADGIFSVETLGRIDDLTKELSSLRRTADGQIEVVRPARGDRPAQTIPLALQPRGLWRRMLAAAFRQDAERLFTAEDRSAIIVPEIMSPSVVDNIRQAEHGRLKIEYLMEQPPATRAEALAIRDDALGNPLYKDTLVSADGRAIALYIPIVDKTYSHNVANLVRQLTADWPETDQVYITGQPVAQDTFGVEMLVQMATSAPLAALAIFLLMLLFFKRVSLIIAPMLIAVLSVIYTMGLLIGLGYDVHIMSSMIAIFLMPIAVADAIHVLSEFYDVYPRICDKAKTVRYVVGHLFKPMLYTSLTTIAGFASLATTPIPPVRVFGLHVAFGVAVAWLLTMTLVPAYIMLVVPERIMLKACPIDARPRQTLLMRFLAWLGGYSVRRWRVITALTLIILALSAWGITRIQVNDNPVKWFGAKHEIRVADAVLNRHFGGTYTAYLTLRPTRVETFTCREIGARMRQAATARFAQALPEGLTAFEALLQQHEAKFGAMNSEADLRHCFVQLVEETRALDDRFLAGWQELADVIMYLEPADLTPDSLVRAIADDDTLPAEVRATFARDFDPADRSGPELHAAALAFAESYSDLSFREFVFAQAAELTAPLFKRPEILAWVEGLQAHLAREPLVGKSSSALDALKKAHYELNFLAPAPDADAAARAAASDRNDAFYAIPPTAAAVGQVFTQLEGMKKRDSLFHLVTRDYQALNIWVQLRSGDNRDMEAVVAHVDEYFAAEPPPTALMHEWAGLTYLNVVWQDKMVRGMLYSLGSSFVIVLLMMMILFRSPLFGLLSMIPLTVTITLIYGLIGWVGKDYDMPVAILSALTLGLSVDFAIHFLERAREMQREHGSWRAVAPLMFKEPAMAISRNAIVISIGFTPLLLAPLVPYRTVGFFLATIMAVSWLATLFLLSALITAIGPRLFQTGAPPAAAPTPPPTPAQPPPED